MENEILCTFSDVIRNKLKEKEMLYTRRDVGRIAVAAGVASTTVSAPRSRTQNSRVSRSAPSRIASAVCRIRARKPRSSTSSIPESARANSWASPVNDWARKKGKWDSSPGGCSGCGGGERTRRWWGSRRGGTAVGAAAWARRWPLSGSDLSGSSGNEGWLPNDQPAGQWNGVACPVRGGGTAVVAALRGVADVAAGWWSWSSDSGTGRCRGRRTQVASRAVHGAFSRNCVRSTTTSA